MEVVVTDRVDISIKTGGKCKCCGRTLKRGLPRIRRTYTTTFGQANGFVCYKCYPKIMDEEVELLKYILKKTKILRKTMDKLVRKNHKMILAEEIDELNKTQKDNN